MQLLALPTIVVTRSRRGNSVLLKLVFILMIIFAIFSIQTDKLRRAVVYLGIFSLISSFAYLLYSAPDVAIAEAIIGSTLATIIYLVALQKYKVFTIYYTDEMTHKVNDKYIAKGKESIIDIIERFCIEKELEPQMIYTTEGVEHIMTEHQHDLIVRQNDEDITVYGNPDNYQMGPLIEHIKDESEKNIVFVLDNEN